MGKYSLMDGMNQDFGSPAAKMYGGGDGMLPSLTGGAASPVSGGFTDKESYLSSPSTEVEEPDSSGKCSTDVVEQKGGFFS